MVRSPKTKRASGAAVTSIDQLDNADLSRWAAQAGYHSITDENEFRAGLGQAISFFTIFTASPSAAQVRQQMKPVADAAKRLSAALGDMDDKVARYFLDRLRERVPRQDRALFASLAWSVERIRDQSAALADMSGDDMPGLVYDRSQRSDDLADLAADLVRLYEGRSARFKLDAPRDKDGTVIGHTRDSGRRFVGAAYSWFDEIMQKIVDGIDPSEIDDAAKAGRAIVNLDRARARLLGILRARAAAD